MNKTKVSYITDISVQFCDNAEINYVPKLFNTASFQEVVLTRVNNNLKTTSIRKGRDNVVKIT